MTHTAEFAHAGDQSSPLFCVRVEGPMAPGTFNVFLKYRPVTEYSGNRSEPLIRLEMPLGNEAIDDYELYLTRHPRGERILYYIAVEDTNGRTIATLPENAGPSGELLPFQFRDIPPTWMVITRTSFISAALLAATLALFATFGIGRHSQNIAILGKASLWTTVFLVLGGVLFEIVYTRAVLGGLGWGGWPLGEFDLSHTLTEVTVVFWIVLTLLLKGSAFANRDSSNLISVNSAGILGTAGYLLTLTIYLIPQSAG
jgi:hypothetical protein